MQDCPQLSYAAYFDNVVQRHLVRLVERLSGQPKLQALYEHYRSELDHLEFFDTALKLLQLDIAFDDARLNAIPKDGPLVVVANHPFGVLDGLIVCALMLKRRSDFKVLTNAVLEAAPEAEGRLLPVDFSPTKEARAVNLETRAECLRMLKNGECVIVFPAGGVSTSPAPFMKAAIDAAWKPFTASLISRSGASVTPIYFEGQNSRLFQVASHISLELRLALIFREVRRLMGATIPVHIGETYSSDDMKKAGKRQALVDFLRRETYAMAPNHMQNALNRAEQKASKMREKGHILW